MNLQLLTHEPAPTPWIPNGRTMAGRREIKAQVERWFKIGLIRPARPAPPIRRVLGKYDLNGLCCKQSYTICSAPIPSKAPPVV
jgi:hypothetical protein